MSKIAVLVSGTGTNMTKLIEENIDIEIVIADRDCLAIDIAKKKNIKTYNVGRYNVSEKILDILKNMDIDLIVLAGFLSILDKSIIEKYKIINIHPSLLPKYGGKGMYGMNIHKKVFENKEEFSGVTVHYVNEGIDTGKIIKQVKVYIKDCKSAEQISKRILEQEWKLLPKVVKSIVERENI